MDWPIEYLHYIPSSSTFVEMMRGAKKIVEVCAGLREGETVTIVTDTNKLRIAEVLSAAVFAAGGQPVMVVMIPTGAHGAEPPEPVVAACRESNVYIFATTWNLQHTSARTEAIRSGSRGTTMPQVTEDLLITGGILADFEECDKLGRKFGPLLESAQKVRIISESGTDISAKVKGRRTVYETGLFREPGQCAALPNSEINISPIEGTSEGVIAPDVRLGSLGITHYAPVTIEVEKGRIVNATGDPIADQFTELLKSYHDETVYNIAEIGLGLNPAARLFATFLEDEGRLGNGHVGIGSNWAIGGNVRAPIHMDLIFKDVSLYLDGQCVIQRGQFLEG